MFPLARKGLRREIKHYHHSDTMWASWRLILPATQIIVQKLFQTNNKEIIK